MDVLTYNIHSCIGTDNLYSVDRVANVIQEANSDIVCLQEVEVNDAFLKNLWSQYHRDDQVALIANTANFKYHVFVPAIRSRAESNWKERHQDVSDNDVSGSIDDAPKVTEKKQPLQDMGKFGIAILSKFPNIETEGMSILSCFIFNLFFIVCSVPKNSACTSKHTLQQILYSSP